VKKLSNAEIGRQINQDGSNLTRLKVKNPDKYERIISYINNFIIAVALPSNNVLVTVSNFFIIYFSRYYFVSR